MSSAALWVCGAASCADKDEPKGKAPARAQKSAQPVHVSKSFEKELRDSLSVTGTLAAADQVTLSVKVPGRLQSISVDLGSVVKRGQVIAQIEPADYQLRVQEAEAGLAQARALLGVAPHDTNVKVDVEATTGVRQAQATLDEARANLDRSKSLLARKLIAPAEYDAANAAFLRAESALLSAREEIYNREAQLAQRKSELMLAQRQVADSAVRAPLDGVVAARHASAGEFLNVGAPVATLVQVDPLRLRVDIPERDAAFVKSGLSVQIIAEGSEGVHTGTIARVSPIIDAQNRTLAIEADVKNPDGALRPGSFVRAQIATQSARRAIVVPMSALVVFAGIEKVLCIEDGKVVEKAVQTGRRLEGLVELVSGLEVGQDVITDPGNLQQGEPVEVVAGVDKR